MSAPNAVVPVAQSSALPVAAGETASSAIAAREKASVEARFLVARARPRNFDDCRVRILAACARPKFAEVARYEKPVGRERVTGLSVRFAEEAATLWANVSVSSLLVFDDDERRIYRVEAIDLETNRNAAMDVMVEKFVERRQVRDGMEVIGSRTNTRGDTVYKIRATEDDLTVKVNALIAKARRNVILELLPADIKEEAEETVVETMANRDQADPDGARKNIVDKFFKVGVMPSQLADCLGHPLEQSTPAELTLLRSWWTALKTGESTWLEIVEAHGLNTTGATTDAKAAAKGTDGLRNATAKAAGKAKTEPAATAADPAKGAAAPTPGAKPDNVCEACGGKDGNHGTACPYYVEPGR